MMLDILEDFFEYLGWGYKRFLLIIEKFTFILYKIIFFFNKLIIFFYII